MISISDLQSLYMLEYADNPNLETKLKNLAETYEIIEQKSEIIESLELELEEYFEGELRSFKTPVHLIGTDFQQKCWHYLASIEYGHTVSYKMEALAVGQARASRAVANANKMNRLAIIIPCHRVIASNGLLGGYDGGIYRKESLLKLERGK